EYVLPQGILPGMSVACPAKICQQIISGVFTNLSPFFLIYKDTTKMTVLVVFL
uniref:Uncharacterized protein n=1 Tax=Oryza brachyantha TaxID=4533 RepID=J3MR45_ORYBR